MKNEKHERHPDSMQLDWPAMRLYVHGVSKIQGNATKESLLPKRCSLNELAF